MTDYLIKCFVKNADDTKNPDVRQRYGVLGSMVGAFCNIFLFITKLILGAISASIAITADAFNNLSDVASAVVTLVGFKMASKPADKKHPFGHGRIEYISGVIISFFVMRVGIEIGKSSIDRIFNPEPVEFSVVVIIGLVISIVIKIWMSLFDKKLGRRIGSSAIEAASVDSLTDVFATTVTLISVVAARFTALPIDGAMGVLVAALIILAGYGIAKDTLNPLLGVKPDAELLKNIEAEVMSFDGILGIHDLIVHDYGPSRRFGSLHAEVSVHSNIIFSHEVIDRAERAIAKDLNVEMVIHLDPIETDCEKTNQMHVITLEKVQEVNPKFTIHDFRIVQGRTLTNFIFDICVPMETKMSDDDVKSAVAKKMSNINPEYYTVINVDRSYV
ncbi:MAG: cation diffusion facilitator family transporter [Hydrogenoanaerobacterium sp.]